MVRPLVQPETEEGPLPGPYHREDPANRTRRRVPPRPSRPGACPEPPRPGRARLQAPARPRRRQGAALVIRQGDLAHPPAAVWIIGRDEREPEYSVVSEADLAAADAVLRAVFPDEDARQRVDKRMPPPSESPLSGRHGLHIVAGRQCQRRLHIGGRGELGRRALEVLACPAAAPVPRLPRRSLPPAPPGPLWQSSSPQYPPSLAWTNPQVPAIESMFYTTQPRRKTAHRGRGRRADRRRRDRHPQRRHHRPDAGT